VYASRICRTYGAGDGFVSGFYKYITPMALAGPRFAADHVLTVFTGLHFILAWFSFGKIIGHASDVKETQNEMGGSTGEGRLFVGAFLSVPAL
jgi:hypothetical protein